MKTLFSVIAFTCASAITNAQPSTAAISFGTQGKIVGTSIWADFTAVALQADGIFLLKGLIIFFV